MSKRKPTPRAPATDLERKAIAALGHCTFLPGSFDKRFVRGLQPATELTVKQREWLQKLFYKYRRQMRLTDEKAKRVVDRMKGLPVYTQVELP